MNFWGLRYRSKSNNFFPWSLALSSVFWDGTKKTESGASSFDFCGQETLILLKVGPPRSYMWTFEGSGSILSWVVPFHGHWPFLQHFGMKPKKLSLGHHRSAFVGKKLRYHSKLDHPVVHNCYATFRWGLNGRVLSCSHELLDGFSFI